jgi:hypothetical protein
LGKDGGASEGAVEWTAQEQAGYSGEVGRDGRKRMGRKGAGGAEAQVLVCGIQMSMLRGGAELHALEGLQHDHVASYRCAFGGTDGRLRLVLELRDAGCTVAAALAR